MTGNAEKPKELLADQELIGFTRHSSGGEQVLRRASSAKVTFEDFAYEENSFEYKVRNDAGGRPEIIVEQVEGTGDVFPGRAALVISMKDGTSSEEAEQLVDQMRKYISEPSLEKKT